MPWTHFRQYHWKLKRISFNLIIMRTWKFLTWHNPITDQTGHILLSSTSPSITGHFQIFGNRLIYPNTGSRLHWRGEGFSQLLPRVIKKISKIFYATPFMFISPSVFAKYDIRTCTWELHRSRQWLLSHWHQHLDWEHQSLHLLHRYTVSVLIAERNDAVCWNC